MTSVSPISTARDKESVGAFWNAASCGEVYARQGGGFDFDAEARTRYELEPYIREFARFEDGAGMDVLEVGVGMGADFSQWARSRPKSLCGVDLTPRGVELTGQRLARLGLAADLRVADAETLPFADGSFDLVYSWGVLHHTPDTPRAIREVWRVLRPGGTARVMIYHAHSLVGAMLWARYGLLAGAPLTGLAEIYARHLESPGTKAYTLREARLLFAQFARVELRTQLSFGDLLQGSVGQRHGGAVLSAAKAIYPRGLVRRLFPHYGLYLLVEAVR